MKSELTETEITKIQQNSDEKVRAVSKIDEDMLRKNAIVIPQ